MVKKEKNQNSSGFTRRDFIKKTTVAGAALGAATMMPSLAKRAFAAKRD